MPKDLPGNLPSTFTAIEAYSFGMSKRSLRDAAEEGAIERIAHGIYRRGDADPADTDLIEIAVRAPQATLCLETALATLGLSDLIPARPDIALPRRAHRPAASIPVMWHAFDPATFDIGRETLTLDPATRIGLYGPERSIIDTVRLRHRQGPEVAYQAIRRYFAQPGTRAGPLLAMARNFPQAQPELRRILEIFLS